MRPVFCNFNLNCPGQSFDQASSQWNGIIVRWRCDMMKGCTSVLNGVRAKYNVKRRRMAISRTPLLGKGRPFLPPSSSASHHRPPWTNKNIRLSWWWTITSRRIGNNSPKTGTAAANSLGLFNKKSWPSAPAQTVSRFIVAAQVESYYKILSLSAHSP